MSSRFIMPFADVGSGIKPSSGAKLFFFELDGVTLKNTFSDQLSTPTANTNPVISDSNGVFGDIYIDGSYKVDLQNKNGSQIFGGAIVDEFGGFDNLSTPYEFATVEEYKDFNKEFPTGKVINLLDRGAVFTVISGTGTANTANIIASNVFSASASLQVNDTVVFSEFGVSPSNADNAAFITAAIDYAKTNVLPINLGTKEITTKSSHDFSGVYTVYGTAKLIFEYEQSGLIFKDNAGMYFLGVAGDSLELSSFEVEYSGTFDVVGGGSANGIYIEGDYDEVNVYGVEATKFNASGLRVNAFGSVGRVKTLRVSNCELNENRVAGVDYGNVDNVSINGNSLKENGLVTDGGTGYGCASNAGTTPTHIRIHNNYTYRNFRKGIDCHEGDYIDISHNQCYQDRLWGIYAKPRAAATSELVISVANNQVEPDPDFFLNNPSYLTYRAIEVGVEASVPNTVQINATVINNECTGIASNNPGIVNINQVKGIYLDIENNPTANTNLTANGNTVRGGIMLPFDVLIGGVAGKTFIDLSFNKYRAGDIFFPMRVQGVANSYITRNGNKGTAGAIQNHFNISGSAPVTFSAEDNDEICTTCSQGPIVAVASDVATVNNNKFTGAYSINDLYLALRLVAKNNFINGVAMIEYDSGALVALSAAVPVTVATLLDRGVSGSIKVRWQAQNSDGAGVTFAHGEFVVGVFWASSVNKVALTTITELYNTNGANTLTPIVMTVTAPLNLAPRTIDIIFQADQVCTLSYEIEIFL